MPYKNDPRRTLTLNLLPEEYAAVAAQATAAGYATPGPYAKARVLNPVETAPDPAEAAAAGALAQKQAAQLAASKARASKWAARAQQAEQALVAAQQALADAPNAVFEQYRPFLENLHSSR